MALLKKKLAFAFAISLMFVACGDDSVSGSKSEINEATVVVDLFDDLPNCSKNRNGDIAEVLGEKKAYICDNRRWEYDHDILDSVKTEDDLSACLIKNEGDSVWVVDESAVFVCIDRKWEKHEIEKPVEDSSFIPVYKSDDDLPNCTKGRQNSMAMVDSVVQLCKDGRWEIQGHAYVTEGDLPNCTAKRNRESVFLLDSEIKMICLDKRWTDSRDIVESSSAGKVTSSSSKKTSSSSSVKVMSSSSKKVESSSANKPSSSSIASVKESSSSKKIESSSSVKSSSSVQTVSSSSAVSSNSKEVESSSSSAKEASSSSKIVEQSSESKSSSSSIKPNSSSVKETSSSSESVKQSSSSQKQDSSSSSKANWVYLNPKISYGEIIDTRDGQVYKTVKIGSNIWMAENMNYAVSESFCMKDSKDSCAKYGRLYTLDVAKTICPTGWKLPAISDWEDLYAAAKAVTTPADSAWKELWSASYYDFGTDKLGFSGVPTSVWDINRSSQGYIMPDAAFFLSSTGINTFELYPHSVYFGYYSSNSRLAVRCIKK